MKFGIIGYGNLGKAVASALINTGDVKAGDIHICDKSEDALIAAKKEHFSVYVIEDINYLLNDVDIICLVVKGYVFEELSKKIDKQAVRNKLIISFMAGVSIEKIDSFINDASDGSNPLIARAMPSLAIATNDGVIAYTKLPENVAAIFSKFGFAFETLPENIEKVTAFASCGLGFASYLIDAFSIAGESLGFPPETAALIATRTFQNACSIGNFSNTVKAVATPGGATEQGINHMDGCEVYKIISEAVQKAYKKMI